MATGYNTKNYFAHGGGELVIGGKLTFLEGSTVEGLRAAETKMQNVPKSTATTVAGLKEDFNIFLDVLKNAGFMVADVDTDDADSGDAT